jgi:hypothetical protein
MAIGNELINGFHKIKELNRGQVNGDGVPGFICWGMPGQTMEGLIR